MSWSKSLVGSSMPVLRCGVYLEEWFGEVTSKGSTPSLAIQDSQVAPCFIYHLQCLAEMRK